MTPLYDQDSSLSKTSYIWAIVMALLTFALFSPSNSYKFLTYDDNQYVYQNPIVKDGLSAESLKEAWTSYHASYYTPVLWMSFLVDEAMHGMDPRGYHLTNNILHAINAGLVFFLLRLFVGASLPAFIGAAIFAWHPLRLESVVWITERKDVLSLFWGLLAILVYMGYVKNKSKARMTGVALLMLVGLLTKPSLIVLPALLVLLDYWPLNRSADTFPKLILEKVILWIIALGITVVTLLGQSSAIVALEETSLLTRLTQVPATYIFYLWKTVWPVELTILYPEIRISGFSILSTTFALVAVSLALLTKPSKSPGLAVGWLWFIIALLPVCGIVRSGTVHLADRFTYLPAIGLSIGVAWLARELAKSYRPQYLYAALIIPAAFAFATWKDMPRWKDSISLYVDAIKTAPHYVAHYNLGNILMLLDENEEASEQFTRAAILKPEKLQAHFNYATAMAKLGKHENAIVALKVATRIEPEHAGSWLNLGNSYYLTKQVTNALEAYDKALMYEPDNARLHNNIAWIRTTSNDPGIKDLELSMEHIKRAIELEPDTPSFRDTYALVLASAGEFEKAVEEVQRAIDGYKAAGMHKNAAESIQRQAAYREGRSL